VKLRLVDPPRNPCALLPDRPGDVEHGMRHADSVVDGEVYPCKRDIFEATYEAVED